MKAWRLFRTMALLPVLLVAAGCSCDSKKPLKFTITFKDAEQLQPGHKIVYNGVPIGVVRDVQLDEDGRVSVAVAIDKEHKERVYREAVFRITKPGGAIDISGERQIEMRDRSVKEKTPVADNDIVEGTGGWLEEGWKHIGDLGAGLRDKSKELLDTVRSYAGCTEADELLRLTEDLLAKAGKASKEEWQELRDKHYPALRERARKLREKLQRDKGPEKAREFWERFEQFWQGIRR